MSAAAPEAPVKDDAQSPKDAVQVTNSESAANGVGEKTSGKKPAAKQPAKPAAKKVAKKPAPKKSTGLTLHQATVKAEESGEPVDAGRIFVMPISFIHRYDNPRHEPEHLYEAGYTLFGNPQIKEPDGEKRVSLVHLALSEDLELVRKYTTLIEQYEGPVMKLVKPDGGVLFTGTLFDCEAKLKDQKDRSGWKIEDHQGAPQSIFELAQDIFLYTQLDPIEVRQNGKVVVDGGRRIAAILYLHAKAKVLKADKAEDKELFGDNTPKEFPAMVQATDLKASGDDFLLACKLNLSRKEFSPLQEGRVYHEMLSKINPKTGKKYTNKEAAEDLNVRPGTFRNREALWRPATEKNGKRTGLTEGERVRVALGEMTITAASRKALGERHYSETGTPSRTRNRGIPLTEMQRKFDETAENNKERRVAIAECMGLTLPQAVKESEKRVQEQDRKSLAAHEQTARKVKKKKKPAA